MRFMAQDVIAGALRASEIPATIALERVAGAPDAIVHADPGQFERIVLNLIRNAVQAMPSGRRIAVRTFIRDGKLLVEVTDNGPGLSPNEQARIFEPLYSNKAQGIGLGLPISKRYAEHNGGTLEVESGPGKGATFRLTLPLTDNRSDGEKLP